MKKMMAILLMVLLTIPAIVSAQFEQKLTINAGAAFLVPELNVASEDILYNYGVGLDGGIQYNFNRRVSLLADVRFYYMYGLEEDLYYDNLAVGLGLKFNMAPSKKFNPYIFGEANVNFLWFEEWVDRRDLGNGEFIPGYYDPDFGTSAGGHGGIGFDLKMGDNFSIFLQTGLYYTYYDNLLNNFTQAGIRLSMFKSKTI